MRHTNKPISPRPALLIPAALILFPCVITPDVVTAQEAAPTTVPVECVPQIGPQMSVTALDFSPDGQLLAQGGGGGWGSKASEINLWDVPSGELLRTLPASSGPVTMVRFLANGTQLVTATTSSHGTPADGIVRFWEVKSGHLLRTLVPQGAVFAVAVSDDGQWVARSQPSPETLHHPSGRLLTLENIITGTKRTLAAAGVVYRLSFSADSRTLLGADAGGIKAWEVNTGVVRALPPAQLERGTAKPRQMELVEHTPRLPQFSLDGTLYADQAPGGFGVWETKTGKRRAWIELPQSQSLTLTDAVFFDDGRQLAIRVGNSLRFWNLVTGKSDLPDITLLPADIGKTLGIAVSPDSKSAAVGIDRWGKREMRTREIIKEIRLLTLPDGAPRRVITGRVNPATWVGFSPDGTTLYSAWHDAGVRFWDARTGQLKNSQAAALGANEAIAVSRDGSLIARGNGFRNESEGAVVLNSSGIVLTKLPTQDLIQHLAIAPDNTRVAVDYGIKVRLYELPKGRKLQEYGGLGGMIFTVAFSPDSKTLATIGTGGACLWSLVDGELNGKLVAVNFNPRQATFSPNGRLIVSVEQDRVLLWDVATQTPLCRWAQEGAWASSAAFSPDGKTLAIATDFAVQLYELKHLPDVKDSLRDGPRPLKTAFKTWNVPGGTVRSIAFAPDGAKVAIACGDGAIRLFHVADDQQQAELRVLPPSGDGEISQEWVTITPAGYFAGSPGAGAFLRWREGDRLIADAEAFKNPARVQQALAP